MRRPLLLAAAAMVAGLLASSGSLATAGNDGDETIVAIAQTMRQKFVDLGRSGESPGDVFVFTDALWNEARTKRIGTRWGQCTLNFGPTAVCLGGARIFGRGKLTGGGPVPLGLERYVVPITGGSGDFRNATGEDRITVLGEGRERLEIHLSGTVS